MGQGHEVCGGYLAGGGGTGSPVAEALGNTMSTLPCGLFWVITKGYSDWPLAPNLRIWPGRMESLSSALRRASRILVLSSVPAVSMALARMRMPSKAGAAYQESTSCPVKAL